MKKLLVLSGALLVVLTGCRSYRQREIVSETYIHKYGVPVAKEDWTRNGKEGQVVLLKNDGVKVSKNYEKGILNGKTTYTFPHSSTIAKVECYIGGELISKVENFISGVSKEEEKYAGNQLVERLCWYEDGTPAATERYENGLILSGEYRTPFNEIESKVAEGKGVRITRGIDGEILFRDTIEGGQMIERVAYFANGSPSSVTSYKAGLPDGTRLTYLQGGLPNTIEEWVGGVQQGVTTVYLNGEKMAEVPYVQGKKHGVELRYRDGKFLVEEVSWKNDIQHGPRRIIVDAENAKTEWYHDGEVVSRSTFERMNPPVR